MARRVRINRQGRIMIPAECRAAAGLKPGGELIVETVEAGELRLLTKERVLKKAQEIVARFGSGRDLAEFAGNRIRRAAGSYRGAAAFHHPIGRSPIFKLVIPAQAGIHGRYGPRLAPG